MKRIVHLIVSLTIGIMFVGCNKLTKCEDTGDKKICENSDNFDDNLSCTWDEKGNEGKGKCNPA